MKSDLERIEIPGEHDARERTWTVLDAAFAERQPTPRRSPLPKVAAVALAAATILVAVVSPPGRAVLDEIREVVGVERAQPALFSLPSQGRLLVASDAGIWIVQADGSKRLLGDFREASWSPFGRFVVATRENELVALEPDGDVRWTLARLKVRFPRWAGSEADTRIAYVSRRQPRVVAGDGTEDQPVCAVSAHRQVPSTWRPGKGFALAVAAPSGIVHVVDVNDCIQRWATGTVPVPNPRSVEWSSDAALLLVTTESGMRVHEAGTGRLQRVVPGIAGAFRPGGHSLALIRRRGELSELVAGGRVLFRGTGEFRELVWSPDGEWILVAWPTADQWVFVRADGSRIQAISNITSQFRSRAFPSLEGWCCAP